MYKLPFSIIMFLVYVFYFPIELFKGNSKRETRVFFAIQKIIWQSKSYADFILKMMTIRTSDYE